LYLGANFANKIRRDSPFSIWPIFHGKFTLYGMIKNNIKIAIRILWKNKLFSLVNILGLSLSMAVGVILFTFIKANHDTDHFHPKLNQLVRILTQETNEVEQTKWATAPLPLAPQLDSISFIEKTVKVRLAGKYNLQTDGGDVP
jgi:putative ABC transport system permease protein